MKKLILMFTMIMAIGRYSYGQNVDDGLVTSHLPVSVRSDDFTSFLNGFDAGVKKVKGGEFKSFEDVANYYKMDIISLPRLDQQADNARALGLRSTVSENFIREMIAINDKVGTQYNDVGQLRNGLRDLAMAGNLSTNEAKTLALLDLTVQQLSKNYDLNTSPASGINKQIKFIGARNSIPGWLRCVLGTIGSAILGGFSGLKAGTTIGGPLGGAVGGVVGVIAGMFSGVAHYCD